MAFEPDGSAGIAERLRDLRAHAGGHAQLIADADWVEQALAKVDVERWERLQAHYAAQVSVARSRPWSKFKYVDIVFHIYHKLRLARELGLDQAERPMRILDLGAGGCHFGFVCRQLGHEVVNLDIKFHVYETLAAILGEERRRVRIVAGERLPDLGGRFDLVTAVSTYFEKIRPRNAAKPYWDVDDWAFLLNDLIENHLERPGRLWFWPNHETVGGVRRRNPQVMDLFEKYGAKVDRDRGVLDLTVTGPAIVRP